MLSEVLEKLKIARKTKGYTQEEVGELVGIKKGKYSRIERGRVSLTLQDFLKIAAALGLKPAKIFAEENVASGTGREEVEETPTYGQVSRRQLDQWEDNLVRKFGWMLDERFRNPGPAATPEAEPHNEE